MVREMVSRVLRGEQGGALYALASRDDHFTRIARVLKLIHKDYSRPLGTEELAKRAGMSVSVFHRHFKLVTACSPLQYLKRIRLDRARTLMTLEGYNAGQAARAVGYKSASQFGRVRRGSSARRPSRTPSRSGPAWSPVEGPVILDHPPPGVANGFRGSEFPPFRVNCHEEGLLASITAQSASVGSA